MLTLLVFYPMIGLTLSLDASIELHDKVNLVAMDRHLTSLLTHPQTGQGTKLLNETDLFCQYLDKVLDLVDEKNPKGTEYYKKFAHAGGIHFINTTFNHELVNKTYKYTEDDFEGLLGTIRETQIIWKCIGVLLNVTRPDSGEHYRETLLANIRARELARGEVENYNDTISLSSSSIDWF